VPRASLTSSATTWPLSGRSTSSGAANWTRGTLPRHGRLQATRRFCEERCLRVSQDMPDRRACPHLTSAGARVPSTSGAALPGVLTDTQHRSGSTQ
jgi:hypothetical protein